MDQLVCVIRNIKQPGSVCLLQSGSTVILAQFNFPYSVCQYNNGDLNLDSNAISSLLKEKLSTEAFLRGIFHIKSIVLPVTKKRIFAFYVLVDIEFASNLKPRDDGDWLWQTSTNLREKLENKQLSKEHYEVIQLEVHSGGGCGINMSTVSMGNAQKVLVDEEQIENCFTNRETKLLTSAKYDRSTIAYLAQVFLDTAFPNESLTNEQFYRILLTLGFSDYPFKSQRLFSLFRAFDEGKRGRLTFDNLLLGFAAMEPHTCHGAETGELRCRYIFRFYCKECEFNMAKGEFITMADDICAQKGWKVESLLQALYENLSVIDDKEECVHEAQASTAICEKPETSDVAVQCSIPTSGDFPLFYTVSKHVLQIQPTGRVQELIQKIPDGVSCSYESNQTAESIAETYSNTAKELLRGLDYFYKPYSRNGVQKNSFDWSEIEMRNIVPFSLHVCSLVEKLFAHESRCLELDDPIYILGDLHGNFADLKEFEERLWPLGPSFCPAKILFLGDYVDRGQFGVETVLYLFAQKILAPDRVFLIRGNHELRMTQADFTFFTECIDRFSGSDGRKVFDAINKCFDALPLAAIVNKKIFCVHGGIPSPSSFNSDVISAINKIPCPIDFKEENMNPLGWQLMWNDPIWENNEVALDKNGFGPNEPRETGHVFSKTALANFLSKHKFSHVIRAHNANMAGFNVRYNAKLLTVFSSSSYCGAENNAACVLLERGRIRLMQMGKDVAIAKQQLQFET